MTTGSEGAAPGFDLDAYLERIGYPGDRVPTLATLAAIQLRHTEAIAFENLNPLMGWPVRLDIESLQEKMVRGGRGGYCYEHNLLFKHALEAVGFHVKGLLARVLWGAPEGAIRPRSHMVLHVDLDGEPYIADAGFGGVTLTGPLRLAADIEQTTPHEPFRLRGVDDEFIEEVKIRDTWVKLYRFGLQEALLPDYEVNNWYTATHPRNLFTNELLAARPAPDRRYALRNNQFTVHHLDGRTERRSLANADEMRKILEGPFGLTLPKTPELDAALWRLTAPVEIKKPSGRLTTYRPDGIVTFMVRTEPKKLPDTLLDAAETVIVRQGITSLTLDAVAAEAGVSKGGLLHHFPNKDRLVEALVRRNADSMRAHQSEAYERTPEGPGRMARALLTTNLADLDCWSEQCRRSSAAAFAALAQNPSLIEPMRAAYDELRKRIADDNELADGVGDTVVAAIDGLWLYWVLGLVPVDQGMIVRVRKVLEDLLVPAKPAKPARASSRKKAAAKSVRRNRS